jgi:hypothetical protein
MVRNSPSEPDSAVTIIASPGKKTGYPGYDVSGNCNIHPKAFAPPQVKPITLYQEMNQIYYCIPMPITP